MDDLTPLQLANEIATHEGMTRRHRYRGHDIYIGPGTDGIHVSVHPDGPSTDAIHERSLWFDAREGGNPGMSNAIQLVHDIDTLIDWSVTFAGLDHVMTDETDLRAELQEILEDSYGYLAPRDETNGIDPIVRILNATRRTR